MDIEEKGGGVEEQYHDTAVKLSLGGLSLHLGWASYLSKEEEGTRRGGMVTSDMATFTLGSDCDRTEMERAAGAVFTPCVELSVV